MKSCLFFDIDIYVASVSHAHNVCAQNYNIAIVSTIVETENPERECEPGLALLGPISERYCNLFDKYLDSHLALI
jgi:Rab GDP dissociation inhibitor